MEEILECWKLSFKMKGTIDESLKLTSSSIVYESEEFKQLKEKRHWFISQVISAKLILIPLKACAKKYLSEAHGSKGYKMIEAMR